MRSTARRKLWPRKERRVLDSGGSIASIAPVCSSGQTLLNRNGRSVASGSRQDSSTRRRCVAELSFAGRASSFSAPRSNSPRRWKRGIEDPVRLALPSNLAMQQGWVPPRCSCGRTLASASAAWRDPGAVTREARPCELQKGRANPRDCRAAQLEKEAAAEQGRGQGGGAESAAAAQLRTRLGAARWIDLSCARHGRRRRRRAQVIVSGRLLISRPLWPPPGPA